MTIIIEACFAFAFDEPTDALLQFEAASLPEQRLAEVETTMSAVDHCVRVAAQDAIGERIWIRATGRFEARYRARVEVVRERPEFDRLRRVAPQRLPGCAIQYLFDSRYCQADRFQSFVEAEFGGYEGGQRIAAFRDWIADHFRYEPGSSTPATTALDSFVERRGICRDYAHVLVALARASGIPARYVACFAPGVDPPDFHACVEVFLVHELRDDCGAWHLVDATGMADPAETAIIGVGRDAADVSYLTSFGPARFLEQQVRVSQG